jgi:hypothetical protein
MREPWKLKEEKFCPQDLFSLNKFTLHREAERGRARRRNSYFCGEIVTFVLTFGHKMSLKTLYLMLFLSPHCWALFSGAQRDSFVTIEAEWNQEVKKIYLNLQNSKLHAKIIIKILFNTKYCLTIFFQARNATSNLLQGSSLAEEFMKILESSLEFSTAEKIIQLLNSFDGLEGSMVLVADILDIFKPHPDEK